MARKPRPTPNPDTLAIMLEHIGAAAWELCDGQARWLLDHDIPAGRASSLAARALIEFLVGRDDGSGGVRRNRADVWPCDYHRLWTLQDDDVQVLRRQLAYLDARVAHLSLTRADPEGDRPERWSDTVDRIFGLVRRFADEISDHPEHGRLVPALDNAAARLAEVSPKGMRRRLDERRR